jgi:hypothetical protein
MKKKWVLVFDQVNELFYRPELKEAEDLGSLPFPFSVINNIMRRDRRIVSIISASTDNEVAYNYDGIYTIGLPVCIGLNYGE